MSWNSLATSFRRSLHLTPHSTRSRGRDGSSTDRGADFDWELYLARYPDLCEAGIASEADAWAHWRDHGQREGRWASRLRRPARDTLVCPTVDSVYLRATGDLVCWDDAGNDTVLQGADGSHHYGRDVWLGEPFERVRRQLWEGQMPHSEICQKCLGLITHGLHSSEAVDRRRMELLQIEPSYHCSLDCPGCVPLAVRRAAPPRHLDEGLLRRILADFVDSGISVRAIDFQGHGEPLLHPRLWHLTRLVKSHFPTAFASMTTNCQAVLKDPLAPQALDEVVCAIDGACESSYVQYRIGGSFPLAVRFMRDVATGVRRGGHSTQVVWKYVLFSHNSSADELREAQRLATQMGVHELRFVFTRNGPAASHIYCEEDLPAPPAGLRQTLERHEPSLHDLDLRVADAAARIAEGDREGAHDLALSVARSFGRFYRDSSDLNGSHRQLLHRLLELGTELDPGTAGLVTGLVSHLRDESPPESGIDAAHCRSPGRDVIARTVDLVRGCRAHLANARAVTGIRPLYQDDHTLYPQFVEAAEGCRLTDTCGRSYLDWMSGYGTAILGYRCREVEQAVKEQFRCGPVLPFGHPLEVEVAAMLKRLIPCAERVGFGKNGSDAVTAAVRIARLVTGRQVVLFHGYHGFHDWYAASDPEIGGIPAAVRKLIVEFPWGDLEALERLFDRHRGDVAAVVMEPAKHHLPDTGYLDGVKRLAHRHGSILVFDEIVTGFRVALGGMQELSGALPDLACFSKAMANGWSVSALVGRADLMDRWPQIGVDMTWRAETPSLAAARCVLTILERDDVPALLAATGSRLRAAFDRRARELGIAARLTGHPARLSISFDDHAELSGRQLLEWFIDESLRLGLITNGTLLPNAAHDDRAIEETTEIFDRALARLAHAVAARGMHGLGAPRGPRVFGCIDRLRTTDAGLEVGGWVLTEDGFPLTVEIEAPCGHRVSADTARRPDVARAHPMISGAQESGWIAVLGRPEFFAGGDLWSFAVRGLRAGRPVITTHTIHPAANRRPTLPITLANGELIETSSGATVP